MGRGIRGCEKIPAPPRDWGDPCPPPSRQPAQGSVFTNVSSAAASPAGRARRGCGPRPRAPPAPWWARDEARFRSGPSAAGCPASPSLPGGAPPRAGAAAGSGNDRDAAGLRPDPGPSGLRVWPGGTLGGGAGGAGPRKRAKSPSARDREGWGLRLAGKGGGVQTAWRGENEKKGKSLTFLNRGSRVLRQGLTAGKSQTEELLVESDL